MKTTPSNNRKIAIGDTVEMTGAGIAQGLDGCKKRRRGRVIDIYPRGFLIVKRTGLKRHEKWSRIFWRKKVP